MAPINLSRQDRIYLERIVATEADHGLARRDPDMYRRQVAGIVDTVLNRVASPQFPDTIAGVANQRSQFSAINGPRNRDYTVWGSVEAVPDDIVPSVAKEVVNDWVNARIGGAPSSIGGNLHYANPHLSDDKNKVWIEALDGPRYGSGQSIHYHGTTDGFTPIEAQVAGDYYSADGVKLPPGEIPNIVATELAVTPPQRVAPTMPTPRDQRPAAQVQMPTPADQRPPDRPQAEFRSDGAARLLPTIGPTGIERADDVGAMPSFAEVSGLGRRQPVMRPEEVASTRHNGMTPELDGEGNVRYRHIPPEDLVRTSVTGGLGSLTPNPVQETAPDPIPPSAYSKATPPVPTNGGFAGQERAPVAAPQQAAQRIGAPQAGQVALPADVKPAAASRLMEQAQVAQRRSQLEQQPASFAGQERTTAIKAPRPVSRAAISYAGQDRAPPRAAAPEAPRPDPMPSSARTELTFATPTFAGREGAPPPAAPSSGNNLGSRTRPEPTATPGAPPNVGARPRPEPPPPAAGTAPGAAAAASPADVPKYITRTERIEIPQRFAGEDAAKPKGGVPLGERTYSGSRDSKAQVEAGENAAATMGEQLRNTQQGPLYRTRTVVELNPKWVEAQKPIGGTPTAKPQEQRPFIETVRTGLGLPAEGFGPGILRGIQDGFANAFGLGGAGRPGAATRTQRAGVPLSPAQIQAARANPQNHNALAMAAIERGQRSYTTSGGAVMPTTAMNGKVRNTYGDSGGGSLSG